MINTIDLAWYCARTKPKHEHIAAGCVRDRLGLEVFYPRLRMERATQRGIVRVVEPLFPCYIFVRCVLAQSLNEIQYSSGISTIVHFSTTIPTVPDPIIEELRDCFDGEEPMATREAIVPGMEVLVAEGAFEGMRALVLRVLPAKQRVQLLLSVLGRPTPVEINRSSVTLERSNLRDLVPALAVPHRESVRL
jgi:transcriptional antiterminator RfaH